jgi:phosphoribosylaminoimidazolecarboxamide formyltransferase/IMP cyclohydrolase
VDRALAERLHQNFIEVLIAPGFDDDALEVLQQKEAIRILEDTEQRDYEARYRDIKRVRGGLLVQDPDRVDEGRESMQVVTESQPSEEQWADLLFAWRVCRHVRSNAIVVARDGATLGIGAGQMSRVDSVRIAYDKARDARGDDAGGLLAGSVVASDAFFPFPDGPEAAMDAGSVAFIQPGGSVRDREVIAACDARGAAMVFTGRRHFRH